jgi:hypothetical protein
VPIPGSLPGKRRKDEVLSDPLLAKKRIKNIYWDPDTKEIVIEVED